MGSLLRGLRSGGALFRTNPGAAIAAVVALSLGIGFSTTMFSIVHGGTRGLPFDEGESIVAVQRLATKPGAFPTSTIRDFTVWARDARSFEALGAFQSDSRNLGAEGGSPERVSVAALTPGTIELLRVQPAAGRTFLASDSRPGAADASAVARTPGICRNSSSNRTNSAFGWPLARHGATCFGCSRRRAAANWRLV